MKVLLVDDYPDTANMLAGAWRRHGCEVVTAVDGSYALSEISLSLRSLPFDLMVIDIAMPYVDGNSLLKAIHCLEKNQILKTCADIIIYTGHQELYEHMREIKGGRIRPEDCYLKPDDTVKLLGEIPRRMAEQ